MDKLAKFTPVFTAFIAFSALIGLFNLSVYMIIRPLKTDVSRMKTDLSRINTDVSRMKTDIARLDEDMKNIQKDVTEIKRAVLSK